MQAARPNPFTPVTRGDDDHATLTDDAHGTLPALDQAAPRANRIPRLPPARAGLCRRLYRRLNAWHLAWLLRHLRGRLDVLEAAMSEATDLAVAMARAHTPAPWLARHRRDMREQHHALASRWLEARRELDNIEAAP